MMKDVGNESNGKKIDVPSTHQRSREARNRFLQKNPHLREQWGMPAELQERTTQTRKVREEFQTRRCDLATMYRERKSLRSGGGYRYPFPLYNARLIGFAQESTIWTISMPYLVIWSVF